MSRIKKFLSSHVVKVLHSFEPELTKPAHSIPLDLHLRRYLSENKKLGSHDRATITEYVYGTIKHKILLDVISPKPVTWETRVETLYTDKFYNQQKNPSFLPNVRCSCPRELWDIAVEEYGEGKAFDYMKVMNEKAPLTVRVNPLKVTRDELFEKWRKKYKFEIKKTEYSPLGITFVGENKQNLFDLPDFEQGLFEIQDEASQLAALRVECKPGDKVLDYCAGSGGKSLAFAPYLKGTGQIFLHDIRTTILSEAKKRFRRAGIYNVQFHDDTEKLKSLEGKMDWILLDVPCTGTGTLRRNPDLKLKFTKERLQYYVDTQESIFAEALKYLKKNGKIVYVTCSLLPQENLHQVVKFCKKYNMEIEGGQQFQTFPESNQMDAFYSATLKFKK